MIELIQGDCLSAMYEVPDHSVDLILCDLPYGVTRNKWDSVIPLGRLWRHFERIVKDNGAVILFGSGMFTAKCMMSKPDWWRYNLVWEKTTPTGFLNAKKMPLRSHEDIMVFYKKLPVYNPQKTTGHERKVSTAQNKRNCKETTNYGKMGLTTYDSTERYPTSVWKFKTDKQKPWCVHPTQKPLDLLREIILTYTNWGGVVMDATMGSGAVGRAAIDAGRSFIGIESDPHWFDNALRWLMYPGIESGLFSGE